MKKVLVIITMIMVLFASPTNIYAMSIDVKSNVYMLVETKNGISSTNDLKNFDQGYNQAQSCDSLFGSTGDPNSVAWLLQYVFDIIKIVGPLLVVILSSIDFAKVVVKSDDDEMAKARMKLITRLILAAALFFIPLITMVLLEIFGIVSDPTCGLQ